MAAENLNDMYLFAKVVEHGGYSAAASALGMQASRLSRHIVALEQDLGVRLLNRTTRRISVTEAGQTFYRHCAAVVAEAQAARDAIERTRSTPQGLVRLSAPLGLLQNGVGCIISRYLAANPLVRVAIDATNRRVDVIEEGIDIALRVRTPPLDDSDLAVRVLARSEPILVASPRLFEQLPRPMDAAGLAHMPTLAMARPGDKFVWNFINVAGASVSVTHAPRMVTDDMPTLKLAAIDGLGVAQLPQAQVQADLDSGLLERVLPQLNFPFRLVHAVFPSRRGLVPAVRGLLDELVLGYQSNCCLA
ncbi:LysR family transcriptional regulator [Massilia sp. Root351]|nr:LysR family transcriptional regulator [Massilia sp. Root351]